MMKLIDLSLTVSKEMAGVNISPARLLERDGWNATTLELYSHCGTHVDAPIHFGVSDETIDQMPLDKFNAQAWMVDCTSVGDSGLIEVEHLGEVASKVQPGEGLIFKTGWSSKFGTPDYRDKLPRISKGLANWLVTNKVRMIGVEPPSVADVNNIDEVTHIHEILLGGDVTILEGLTNLDAIEDEKVWLMALPLKIKDGDGCPARAVAIVK
ncbi:MAG: cyclase family protein [Cyclobacteriaceae bacterium]